MPDKALAESLGAYWPKWKTARREASTQTFQNPAKFLPNLILAPGRKGE